ncbi:hypothetical protein Nepgr_012400 [Nepenthes gracilis]|uniref:Uncharacterized protein n=1 Tax=Nepenthes gracilis TaxID=150966 RepID=A0AAD3XN35_NEPGR|nr:hypothetical protein Nepgr_012400 [Nepenthes gracilis]
MWGARPSDQGLPETRGSKAYYSARAFAVAIKEPEASPNVVEGTLSVCGVPASILFDSGSAHSFISPRFACHIDTAPCLLNYELSVCTPTGFPVVTDIVYPGCVMEVDEKCLIVDLVLLDMGGFDVILGMDWLAKNHATIDCFTKKVYFNIPEMETLFFQNIKKKEMPVIISALHAKHLVKSGCKTYLAYARTTGSHKMSAKDIQVIYEFEDVFPEELPGLPPYREIEFEIFIISDVSNFLLISESLPLLLSCMSPSLSASKGSAMLLDQGQDDSSCLKAASGLSADSVTSPRFSLFFAGVDSLLELIPKDALDVNGLPGKVEAVDLPEDVRIDAVLPTKIRLTPGTISTNGEESYVEVEDDHADANKPQNVDVRQADEQLHSFCPDHVDASLAMAVAYQETIIQLIKTFIVLQDPMDVDVQEATTTEREVNEVLEILFTPMEPSSIEKMNMTMGLMRKAAPIHRKTHLAD